jgi:hypothetical protein
MTATSLYRVIGTNADNQVVFRSEALTWLAAQIRLVELREKYADRGWRMFIDPNE